MIEDANILEELFAVKRIVSLWIIRPQTKYFLIIFTVCLFVNWPIFYSDILVNDDLTIVTSNNIGDFDGLKSVYFDLGKPGGYYFHRSLAFITPPGTIFYKVCNFILMLTIGIVFFLIAWRAWSLRVSTALIATIGAMCFPSIGIQPFAMGTSHFLFYLLFFVAMLLAYRYWCNIGGLLSLIMGCVSIGIAARLSSVIPFLYVFLFSFFLIEWKKLRSGSDATYSGFVKGIWISALLTLVMMITYFGEGMFFEQHQWYAGGYNALKFNLNEIIRDIVIGIKTSYLYHIVIVLKWPILRLVGLGVFSLVAFWLYSKLNNAERDGLTSNRYNSCVFISVIAVTALVMAVLPYAVVGKIPASEGYQTRWAILANVSGGLSVAVIYELACVSKIKWGEWFWGVIALFLCGSFTIQTWDHYGKWQRVAIENGAMISKMKLLDFRPEVDIYCVDENLLSEEFYVRRWYDWAYVFSQSWNVGRETMGFPKEYCRKKGMYRDRELMSSASVIDIMGVHVDDMKALSSWMYYGKGQSQYSLAPMRIIKGDDRMDSLSGTALMFESLKNDYFESEIINSFTEKLQISYD